MSVERIDRVITKVGFVVPFCGVVIPSLRASLYPPRLLNGAYAPAFTAGVLPSMPMCAAEVVVIEHQPVNVGLAGVSLFH